MELCILKLVIMRNLVAHRIKKITQNLSLQREKPSVYPDVETFDPETKRLPFILLRFTTFAANGHLRAERLSREIDSFYKPLDPSSRLGNETSFFALLLDG